MENSADFVVSLFSVVAVVVENDVDIFGIGDTLVAIIDSIADEPEHEIFCKFSESSELRPIECCCAMTEMFSEDFVILVRKLLAFVCVDGIADDCIRF